MNKKLYKIINEVIETKENPKIIQLNNAISFREDLGFDSFDLALLTVKIEDEYGVDIFENGIIDTVGEVINILKNVR